MPLTYVIAVCIIVLLVFYFYMRHSRLNDMVGFYVAPDEFAKSSGLNSMSFIITEISTFGHARGFMVLDSTVVPFSMSVPVYRFDMHEVPVTMVYDVDDIDIPNSLLLTLHHGHLLLEDDDNIYVAAQWMPVY